jgi:hypothetical protein
MFMGIKIIVLAAGIILFGGSLFRFIKEYKVEKALRLYGALAYLGFAAAMISGILLLENFLSNINSVITCVVVLAIFSIAGRFLLQPGFQRK